MAKAKVKRAGTSIDMTAMCDVSFLLLTFFVLTATARQDDVIEVVTPSSSYETKLVGDNLGIITAGDKGKVFFGMKDNDVRIETLKRMSAKYKVPFSEEEYEKFKSVADVSVPMRQLRQFLALTGDEQKELAKPGIPIDSTENDSNELYQWVQQARLATLEVQRERENDPSTPNYVNPGVMQIAIKADAEEKYAVMNLIIETLRNQKQNKFSFVTGLKAKN